MLFREAQISDFYEEIKDLEENKRVAKSSALYKLSAYIDEKKLLRIASRLNYLYTPQHEPPIILPRKHKITTLLIMHFHCKFHHLNTETVVNELLQQFHIFRMRTTVRSVLNNCQFCKIVKAKPKPPQMARLPQVRQTPYVAPFTYTGLDFFGPLFVTVNRHKEKRYGALFTCLTIRAVHIEIVYSLDTTSCIVAIRNFIARRGCPREFFSDNGRNFIGAEKELVQAVQKVDRNILVRKLTDTFTKWNFIPPLSPHMGGAWERMVSSVKTVLYAIMQSRAPSDEMLNAMLVEAENTVNSRPLTYLPIDPDQEEALTPNHFLLGTSNGMKPLAIFDDSYVVLKRSWLYSQQLADYFWKRWVAEYMPTLSRRTKWFEPVEPLRVGDLVVIVDPNLPRNIWPRGKILETKQAADGQVRSAKVLTTSGIFERPAVKLAKLDVAKAVE